MPHGSLRRPWCYPAPAEKGSKRMPQRVNVEHPAPLVALGNASQDEVAVQNPRQVERHLEERHIRRQTGRNRLACAPGSFLEPLELASQPGTQIGGKVASNGNLRALTILLIRC